MADRQTNSLILAPHINYSSTRHVKQTAEYGEMPEPEWRGTMERTISDIINSWHRPEIHLGTHFIHRAFIRLVAWPWIRIYLFVFSGKLPGRFPGTQLKYHFMGHRTSAINLLLLYGPINSNLILRINSRLTDK